MHVEVILCNGCEEQLGRPDIDVEVPAVDHQVVDAEGEYTASFADGWRLRAFPNPDDPVATDIHHHCPNCKSNPGETDGMDESTGSMVEE